MARSLGEANGARNERVEDNLLEVIAHLLDHCGIQVRAAIVHCHEQSAERQVGIGPRGANLLGHLHEQAETLQGVVFALDRDEDFVGSGKGIGHQDAEGRRAIEEKEIVESELLEGESTRRSWVRWPSMRRPPPRRQPGRAWPGSSTGSRCGWSKPSRRPVFLR